jgi:hypothetical protein
VSADYSKSPLTRKLGIKESHRIHLAGAPRGFDRTLGKLPPGVQVLRQARGPLDVIVLFATDRSDVGVRFRTLAGRLSPSGGLWVAYPKKSAGVETDLSFEVVQRAGLSAGLVDNKSCAIDETWTALRFVYRLADRPRM